MCPSLHISIMSISLALLTSAASADIAPLRIPIPHVAVKEHTKAPVRKIHRRHIHKQPKKILKAKRQEDLPTAAMAIPPRAPSAPTRDIPARCQKATISQLATKQIKQTISRTKETYNKHAPAIRNATKTAWYKVAKEGHRASAVMAKLISGINK